MRDRTTRSRIQLRVSLFGRLSVRTATGAPVDLGGRHAPALFSLMVLDRRPRSREAIATDLWPESDGPSAGSLRQALWLIRHGLAEAGVRPDAVLEIRPEAIAVRADAPIDVDVDAFERSLGEDGCGLERAIDLYGGDLLEPFGHDCFAAERERLADRYEDALVVVAAQRLANGDEDGARRAAEHVLARDPLREEAHTTLMTVHGRVGSRSQVVRQYRRLRVVLARELGERPLPETEAAYREAMTRTVRRSQEQILQLASDHLPTLVAIGR